MEYATVVSSQHNDQTTLYRYLESILSKEVAHLESLPKNDPNREKGEQGRQELLALTRSFQDTKELLLSYEKEVVKWAAETKLFLITKSDLIEVKSEAIEQKLPTEDFPETIDELEERTSFTHRELARWRNYFIRNGREDLAKRINPKVGDEMGTAEKGEINDLTDRIRTSATVEYAKVTDAQEKQFSDLFSGFQPTFLLPESGKSLDQARTALNEYLSKVPLYKERLTLWNPEQPYPLHRASHWFFARQGLGYQQCSAGLVRGFASAFRIIARQLDRLGFGHSVRRWFGDLVNQIATTREQSIIKPFIEFISAIPSVLIGFFGIAVLGGMVSFIADERLNSLTAGFLLALMTVPTIFTLAEDALNNVPRAPRDASLSLGATRWQTCAWVIFPQPSPA